MTSGTARRAVRLVRAQAELDVREGRKHNVQLGFAVTAPVRHGRWHHRAIDRALRARGR